MLVRDELKSLRGTAFLAVLWVFRALCKPRVLRRRVYHRLVARLIRSSQLFDAQHYLELNPDVADSGMSPLRHYVTHGDREGRWPMPLFDPHYYRTRTRGRTKHVNALLHYLYVGRYRRLSPSPWFDVAYYLTHNKDVARAGFESLYHYLHWGGQEGRSPSPSFDGAYYLRSNPDVREAHLNPLIHYLQTGRFQERPTRPANQGEPDVGRHMICLTDADLPWESLPQVPKDHTPQVDVIVPVYKDRALTLRCLYSVLAAHTQIPYELVVINDASPDETLTHDLQRLAARGLFTLLENETNQGFVLTVNRGMELHPDRDAILLNADTQVYDCWLDRLVAVGKAHPKAASITPLSNNATICSYPRFLHDTPYPLEIPYAELDAIAARVNEGITAEAPTGVGFCMYLRRAALEQLGAFDAETFGKGYGEENDWCQRAIEHGWHNLITANIFVRHIGNASFQGETTKRVAKAMRIMAKRHPRYHRDVEAFIRRDPLAEARRRLDWERLKRTAADENVLIICHNRGGGTERHVQEDTQQLHAQGKGVFYFRPERGRPTHGHLEHPACRHLLNLPALPLADTPQLAHTFQALRITSLHSHGLVDFTHQAPQHLLDLARAMDIPLEVDIHDYKVICPRINLADRHGRYCGEPDEAGCDACLAAQGNDFGVTSIRAWRQLHHQVLKAAQTVWVPNPDVSERLLRYYPDIPCQVASHEDLDPATLPCHVPELGPTDRLRVVVIGAISKLKGYDVLLACAQDARKRRLPIQFIVMGYTHNDRMLEIQGVEISGKYLEHEAMTILHDLRPHVVWLPSLWPETYSYTLSLGLKGGYPVFAFDLGAIAQRLRALDRGQTIYPIKWASDPTVLNGAMLDYRARHLESARIS